MTTGHVDDGNVLESGLFKYGDDLFTVLSQNAAIPSASMWRFVTGFFPIRTYQDW